MSNGAAQHGFCCKFTNYLPNSGCFHRIIFGFRLKFVSPTVLLQFGHISAAFVRRRLFRRPKRDDDADFVEENRGNAK